MSHRQPIDGPTDQPRILPREEWPELRSVEMREREQSNRPGDIFAFISAGLAIVFVVILFWR